MNESDNWFGNGLTRRAVMTAVGAVEVLIMKHLYSMGEEDEVLWHSLLAKYKNRRKMWEVQITMGSPQLLTSKF